MIYHILESGSKGNSTLIVNDNHVIVIDNGLTNKKFNSKINELGYKLEDIEAVLLTHNHSDHISGIDIFNTDLLYASPKSSIKEVPITHALIPYEQYEIGGFKITPLPTSHDAVGSLGFIIEDNSSKLVYITDTGFIYEKVVDQIGNADYYIMESNHNVRMLINTNRPQYLKARIMGDLGHLSNEDSANYICDVIGARTKEITLAHLSEEANTPEKAMEEYLVVFEERGIDASKYKIRCASQKETISGGSLK